MYRHHVFVIGGAVVATLVVTAAATALTVGLRLPLWGAGIVFAAGLLALGALARAGWLGVAGAAAFGAMGMALALLLTPTVWLSCVTGAAVGWYTALTLLYGRGESASACRDGATTGRQDDTRERRACAR